MHLCWYGTARHGTPAVLRSAVVENDHSCAAGIGRSDATHATLYLLEHDANKWEGPDRRPSRASPIRGTLYNSHRVTAVSTKSPGFALQGLKRPGLVSRLSASRLAVRCALARGAALLMARAYTANGQWAVRD
eukprot:6568968-Prymnesium_polylepis.2